MRSLRMIEISGYTQYDRHGSARTRSLMRGRVGIFIAQLTLLALLWMALSMANVASAAHVSWHERSLTYDVHFGVVPASAAQQDREMVRAHKIVGHGRHKPVGSTYHVMVAVFENTTQERVIDAEVVAELVESDLIHIKKQRKPLESMALPNGVTYCNFFDLHWNGTYRVHVTIRAPGKMPEKVTFVQEVYGLPG